MLPHNGQPLSMQGKPLSEAPAAMIMVHGRGATAESILSLADYLDAPDYAFLAPQAANHSWYPQSFLAPIAANEPGISSGLFVIRELIHTLNKTGIPSQKIILLGFSQGACLSVEFAARHPQRYGGIIGLSGALIGPPETPSAITPDLWTIPRYF